MSKRHSEVMYHNKLYYLERMDMETLRLNPPESGGHRSRRVDTSGRLRPSEPFVVPKLCRRIISLRLIIEFEFEFDLRVLSMRHGRMKKGLGVI